ncbi:MAG: GGDEF domain-containing protein [Actinobacteria bacterium]|nr:MAG: GGDEF domain-containing protein [Actinomycetota bacterium]
MEPVLPVAAAAGARVDRRPLPARAQYLIAGLAVATAALFAVSFLFHQGSRAGVGTFAVLLGFVIAADRIELYTGRSHDLRVATMPMIAAALLLPAPLVVLCGFAFAAHRWGTDLLWRQRVFNGCNHALSGLAAWSIVYALPLHDGRSATGLALAGVAASAVYAASTWALLVSILHLTHDLSLGEMREELPAVLSAEAGLGALGIVVAALWRREPVLVPFAVAPLILIWTSLKVSQLRQEANVDAKTGLFNARHLREALASELDRASRYERPLSLLVADLDFLREVNNKYGHLAGDAVLAGIGDVLHQQLRSTDIAARFGGEEFVVVLPETSQPRAVQLADRVRRAVAERAFECGRGVGPVHVTISIGVAAFPADASTDLELLEVADAAVYDAKARGRNRVVAAADRAIAV